MIYSIVTSDNPPKAIEELLASVALEFALRGAILRSSTLKHDHRIRESALSVNGKTEILSPWQKLCTSPSHILINQQQASNTAKRYLRTFRHCNPQQRLLIATIVPQLLGSDCRNPSEVVFYYGCKKNRCIELTNKLALAYNIRQYDLSTPEHLQKTIDWIKQASHRQPLHS